MDFNNTNAGLTQLLTKWNPSTFGGIVYHAFDTLCSKNVCTGVTYFIHFIIFILKHKKRNLVIKIATPCFKMHFNTTTMCYSIIANRSTIIYFGWPALRFRLCRAKSVEMQIQVTSLEKGRIYMERFTLSA